MKQQVLQKASWNLDRIDQQDPTLDGIYRYCPPASLCGMSDASISAVVGLC